jgi:hypothetical protein
MKRHNVSTSAVVVLAFSVFVACSGMSRACDVPDAQRFIPATLVDGDPQSIQCVAERVSLGNGKSPEYLAVAYGNGTSGAFSVIKGTGEDATQVFFLTAWGMFGSNPKIEMIDVDGDASPEMFVSWASAKDLRRTWVFQYHDGAFRSITPTDPLDDEFSQLAGPTLIDFDGDGRKDLVDLESVGTIEPTAEDEVPLPIYESRLYLYGESGFAAAPKHPAFFGLYGRGERKPEPREEQFTVIGQDRSRTLRIVNDGGAGAAVTSATVRLNGVPVVTPSSFKPRVGRFDVPVRLVEGENLIVVEIEGKPASRMGLFIY